LIRAAADDRNMTYTVTPLHCGTLRLDKSILTTQVDSGVTVPVPSICYLIEGDPGPGPILVDTGFGDVELMDRLHPAFDCSRPDGHNLTERLNAYGYEPADIETVVLSHLHWDHCYNLELFEDATIYVQREELEYAIAPYPMHAGGYEAKSLGRTPPWLETDLTPLEGETELYDGVTAFPTPGHTVGHQSVAVDTGDETTIVAADAIPTFENVEGTESAPLIRGLSVNDFDWWKSAQAVLDRGETILPGHEWEILDTDPPAEWAALSG
jgi:glyoxylase-like metal-dependent hydrolase (beta-lactamase superfamily II)